MLDHFNRWVKVNRFLIGIFLIAVFARVSLNIVREEIAFNKPFLQQDGIYDERVSNDSLWYIWAAEGFLKGKGVVSIPAQNVVKWNIAKPDYQEWKQIDEEYIAHKIIPPLYPLFLSLFYLIGGVNTLSYFIPQVLISALTCVLIALLAEDLFGRGPSRAAGILTALYPDLIFWTSFVRTETLFIFLLSLGFYLLIRGNKTDEVKLIYFSGIIFGLACLTRITFTLFVPFLFFWQMYAYRNDKQKALRVSFALALIIFAVLLPWGVRNHVLFNEFNILTDEAGILVGSVGNKEQYRGINVDMNYDAHSALPLKIFFFIKDNFNVYVRSCADRFILFWSPFSEAMRPFAKIYKGVSWFIVIPAAFYGIITAFCERKKFAGLIVMFVFYHALLHSATFVDKGLVYRYPIQPFLCVFAGFAYFRIRAFLTGIRRQADGNAAIAANKSE